MHVVRAERIAVLGASGGIGRCLVNEAYARAYDVVAVVRPGSKLNPPVPVLRGDLTDEAFLAEAIRGSTYVVSGLGLKIAGLAPWNRPEDPTFASRSARALVAAMKSEGVGRLVAVSAGGVGDSRPAMPLFFRAMIAATALRPAYADLDRMEQVFLGSGLDVCIARPGGLNDAEPTRRVEIVDTIDARPISRCDVAIWMLDQIKVAPFVHRVAMIASVGSIHD